MNPNQPNQNPPQPTQPPYPPAQPIPAPAADPTQKLGQQAVPQAMYAPTPAQPASTAPPQPDAPLPPAAGYQAETPLDTQPQPGQSFQPTQPAAPPESSQQSAAVDLAAIVDSQEILCKATTVFPFVLFPDTITVDREKVTINHTSFFRTGDTASIAIDDILNVTANIGPLFGSLKLAIRNVPQQNPPHIHYLTRKDTLCVKNILQGYIIARQNNIDCAHLPKKDLVELLQRLGSGQTTTQS